MLLLKLAVTLVFNVGFTEVAKMAVIRTLAQLITVKKPTVMKLAVTLVFNVGFTEVLPTSYQTCLVSLDYGAPFVK